MRIPVLQSTVKAILQVAVSALSAFGATADDVGQSILQRAHQVHESLGNENVELATTLVAGATTSYAVFKVATAAYKRPNPGEELPAAKRARESSEPDHLSQQNAFQSEIYKEISELRLRSEKLDKENSELTLRSEKSEKEISEWRLRSEKEISNLRDELSDLRDQRSKSAVRNSQSAHRNESTPVTKSNERTHDTALSTQSQKQYNSYWNSWVAFANESQLPKDPEEGVQLLLDYIQLKKKTVKLDTVKAHVRTIRKRWLKSGVPDHSKDPRVQEALEKDVYSPSGGDSDSEASTP